MDEMCVCWMVGVLVGGCSAFMFTTADLMKREKGRGEEADGKCLEWSRNFKVNACESLVYSLVRMQASLRHYHELNKARQAFRRLRLLYIEAKARHMYNHYVLRRWLLICRRYRRLSDGMPRFHALKTKYLSFRRWLAFIEFIYGHRTPGIRQPFRRRRQLLLGYAGLLHEQRLVGTHYHYEFLNLLLTSRHALFLRWAHYTQLKASFRYMSEKVGLTSPTPPSQTPTTHHLAVRPPSSCMKRCPSWSPCVFCPSLRPVPCTACASFAASSSPGAAASHPSAPSTTATPSPRPSPKSECLPTWASPGRPC